MKTTIELAREAAGDDWKLFQDFMPEIHRLADLVRADERERIYFQTSSNFVKAAVAEEREACAKVVEASPSYDWHKFACEAAAAIRARGQA